MLTHDQVLGILGLLPMPMLLVGHEDRILFANTAAEQFFTKGEGSLVQGSLRDVDATNSPLCGLLKKSRERGASVAERNVDVSGHGMGERIADVTVTPATEPEGAYLIVLHDRTLSHRLDRQLQHRASARAVSGMAAILAHEVKNPLAGIRGAAQLLESQVKSRDREFVQLICDEADRVRGLIDRMESFGNPGALIRLPANIHEVLDRVAMIACASFAGHLRIVKRYDPSLPPVLGDRDQLIQAFLNIVRNAADASPVDGTIVIGTAYRSGLRMTQEVAKSLPLEVTISDNGAGIAPDLMPHIFEPFVTTKAKGAGLGLALVAKIIGDHGGIIECESAPGCTSFRVMLPIALTDLDTPAYANEPEYA